MNVDLFQAEVDAGDDGAEEPACLRRRLLFLLIGERSRPSDQAILLDHAFRIRLHRRRFDEQLQNLRKVAVPPMMYRRARSRKRVAKKRVAMPFHSAYRARAWENETSFCWPSSQSRSLTHTKLCISVRRLILASSGKSRKTCGRR